MMGQFRVIEAGWEALGLPVELGDGGPFSYASLAANADGHASGAADE